MTSDIVKLGRVHVAALGAFPYVLGPVLSQGNLTPEVLVPLAAVGVLMHSYGCTVNDIADAKTDRLNPDRRESPLVMGSCSQRFARIFALVQLGVLLGLIAAYSRNNLLEAVGLLLLLVINTYGNLFQKRFGGLHPLGMDLLFGVFMAAPLILSARLAGGYAGLWLWSVAGAFTLFAAFLNVFGGNLKDLAHDSSVGAHTTALTLGAIPEQGKRTVHLTRVYTTYALIILTGGNAILVASIFLTLRRDPPTFARMTAAAIAGALIVLAISRFLALIRPMRIASQGATPRVLWPQLTAFFLAAAAGGSVMAVLGIMVVTWVWAFPTRMLLIQLDRKMLGPT